MAGKTLILPKSDGALGSIDELEWRRRAEERRLGPLFEALVEDTEEDLGEAGSLRGRVHYYGAMAGGHHGHHHDHDSDHD